MNTVYKPVVFKNQKYLVAGYDRKNSFWVLGGYNTHYRVEKNRVIPLPYCLDINDTELFDGLCKAAN